MITGMLDRISRETALRPESATPDVHLSYRDHAQVPNGNSGRAKETAIVIDSEPEGGHTAGRRIETPVNNNNNNNNRDLVPANALAQIGAMPGHPIRNGLDLTGISITLTPCGIRCGTLTDNKGNTREYGSVQVSKRESRLRGHRKFALRTDTMLTLSNSVVLSMQISNPTQSKAQKFVIS